MEQLALIVPGMWADHHVIAVRDLLKEAEGIELVDASAMDTTVRVEYDPSRTDPQKIAARLEQAGYTVGETTDSEAAPTNKPAWATAGVRVTVTDPADLAMSGDHRKY
jgi:copper chaperone CopZ